MGFYPAERVNLKQLLKTNFLRPVSWLLYTMYRAHLQVVAMEASEEHLKCWRRLNSLSGFWIYPLYREPSGYTPMERSSKRQMVTKPLTAFAPVEMEEIPALFHKGSSLQGVWEAVQLHVIPCSAPELLSGLGHTHTSLKLSEQCRSWCPFLEKQLLISSSSVSA